MRTTRHSNRLVRKDGGRRGWGGRDRGRHGSLSILCVVRD